MLGVILTTAAKHTDVHAGLPIAHTQPAADGWLRLVPPAPLLG
jgi:hypothetical protein